MTESTIDLETDISPLQSLDRKLDVQFFSFITLLKDII